MTGVNEWKLRENFCSKDHGGLLLLGVLPLLKDINYHLADETINGLLNKVKVKQFNSLLHPDDENVIKWNGIVF